MSAQLSESANMATMARAWYTLCLAFPSEGTLKHGGSRLVWCNHRGASLSDDSKRVICRSQQAETRQLVGQRGRYPHGRLLTYPSRPADMPTTIRAFAHHDEPAEDAPDDFLREKDAVEKGSMQIRKTHCPRNLRASCQSFLRQRNR